MLSSSSLSSLPLSSIIFLGGFFVLSFFHSFVRSFLPNTYIGEYHYDAAERMLYFWPNSTSASTDTAVDHPVGDLIVPQIKTLVRIDGGSDGTATGVSFTGIGFRDSVATYMEPECTHKGIVA